MENQSTELQKASEAESDNRINKFWTSLANYKEAQASILHLQAKEETPDEEFAVAQTRKHQAIHALLDTPIGIPHQLFYKFEILEELIVQEDVEGKSRDNYPVMALASFKRDLLAIDGKTLDI